LFVNQAFTIGDVPFYIRAVLQIVGNHFVDFRQRERRILASQHLRREAFLVVVDDMLKADTMARDVDKTVRILR
jgi:hypothetical protein